MTRVLLLSLALTFSLVNSYAQELETFTITKEIKHLPVINQGGSGTCWSFATTSFIEAEVIRKGLPEIDLSEMYFAYYAYLDRAEQYLFYHGHNNFSQGGQAHDVFNVIREHGVSTIEDFPGIKTDGRFQDRDLVNDLNIELSNLNKKREDFDASNLESLEPILKKYIGKIPKKVEFENKKYTPEELLKKIEINPDDYIEISSYTQHPFYQPFVLEVPDNWAHGLYYNLPMDEMLEVIKYSIDNGYTVCWDGDTSEKTFQHRSGKAYVDDKLKGKITQGMRQETFYDRTTTDDHLMHIVGLSKDSEENTCFYTKNSWGAESNSFGGYLHLSEDYVRLKTIAILVNKEAIPENIRKKLNL